MDNGDRQAIFEELPIGVVVVTGQQTWLNRVAETITGYSRDEIRQLEDFFTRLFAGGSPEEARRLYLEDRAAGFPSSPSFPIRHRDGSIRWIEFKGRLTGWGEFWLMRDVTDRKRNQDLIRNQERLLGQMSRIAHVGAWEIDAATGALTWSEEVYRIHELDPSTRPGVANAVEFYPGEASAVISRAVEAGLKHGTPWDLELPLVTAKGNRRWVRAIGEAEIVDGKVVRVLGTFQDVTEKMQIRAALIEATAKAEASNRAKSEFLANMSHEIRTPMNGVIGMTELLLETTLDSAQRDYAQTVRDSAAALLSVINDILDFSKVEAGKLDVEQIDMDLRDTVQDVARLLAVQAHAKGLEITVSIDPALPEYVRGDPGRIRQVLVNLGGNAVKFTERGEVALSVRVVGSDAHSTQVRCEIRDTGVGIPVGRQGALFQPFSQLDSSTTRKFGGTGLGLSIVRRLVELMGGETGVQSVEGEGSTFWFTLRLGLATTAHSPQRTMPAALKGQRVLVVDDNATNRRVVEGQLRLCGTEPVCVSSADEAIAAMVAAHAAGRPFSVALLDYQMPGCDGADLGRQIIGDERLKSTRLILLTSSGHRGDGKHFAELGFAGYLLKPVAQRDLVDSLLIVLAAAASEWHTQTQPIVTRHELRVLRSRDKRFVLIAEDNPVNQKVAGKMLEAMGYRIRIANNGREAVAAWQSGGYSLILMDCQMPELDGYEATREIRRRENGMAHIPIVALTAHAMKDADVECRAAGMDDYLTKPIDRAKLEACLERHLTGEVATPAERRSPVVAVSPPGNQPPVDLQALRLLSDGDSTFEKELINSFIQNIQASLESISRALADNDLPQIGNIAHSLKGASATMRAAAVNEAALQVEDAARSNDTPRLAESIKAMRTEADRALEYIRQSSSSIKA